VFASVPRTPTCNLGCVSSTLHGSFSDNKICLPNDKRREMLRAVCLFLAGYSSPRQSLSDKEKGKKMEEFEGEGKHSGWENERSISLHGHLQ
jgi:hypothetical protein